MTKTFTTLRYNQCLAACFCMLTLVSGLAVAQKNGGSADRMNALQTNNSQDRISREVRHELVMLPYYGVFDNLAYNVNGGVVTLYGQVTRPTLKSDAANVVKKIEGVTRVDNQIEVLPLSPMDDQIRRAEYRAIYSEPSLNLYGMQAVPPIHIIVDNGKVTLVGVVDNATDKNIAGVRANAVPGVFSVTNNLQVASR
jgi:hyperosmotically inducible protein